jgi:Barstar (barnase inhibitor)
MGVHAVFAGPSPTRSVRHRCDEPERLHPYRLESVHFMPSEDVEHINWASQPVLHRAADLAGATTRATVLDATAAAFEFPSYFGHNWDALHDCLGDLEWLGAAGAYVLSITGTRGLWADAPDVAGTFTEIWLATAEEWADGSKSWDPDGKPLHLIWAV